MIYPTGEDEPSTPSPPLLSAPVTPPVIGGVPGALPLHPGFMGLYHPSLPMWNPKDWQAAPLMHALQQRNPMLDYGYLAAMHKGENGAH